MAPRRGSFFETWRLFWSGAGRVLFVVLLMVGGLAIPMLMFNPGHREARVEILGVLAVLTFGFATWHLEGEMGERLAYLTIVAQPVDTRRLLLVPMCLLGIVMAVAFPLMGHVSMALAPSFLGIAWGTIAGTRWLWKLRFWPLLVLPILALNPVATYAAQSFAGWGAAAAVSLALGIGALAFQPRPYVGEPLSRQWEGGQTSTRFRAPAARGAISISTGKEGWLAAALRFTQLCFGTSRFLFMVVIIFALTVPLGLMFPVLGRGAHLFIYLGMIPAGAIAAAYSGEMHEFLHPRPFDRGLRFVGGVIPALLIALLAPLTALCLVNLDWINHGGLVGLFKPRAPGEEDIRYLRVVLGASFLPSKWPDGGLPQHLWVQLRPLLYLDVLRSALMIVALLFGLPPRRTGELLPKGGWLNLAIVLVTFAAMARIGMFDSFKRCPLPPTWFIALLAAVSIAHFAWRARTINAPPKPEVARP